MLFRSTAALLKAFGSIIDLGLIALAAGAMLSSLSYGLILAFMSVEAVISGQTPLATRNPFSHWPRDIIASYGVPASFAIAVFFIFLTVAFKMLLDQVDGLKFAERFARKSSIQA
jgi:hypothetical protein